MSQKKDALVLDALQGAVITSMGFDETLDFIAKAASYHKIPFVAIFQAEGDRNFSITEHSDSAKNVLVSGGFPDEVLTQIGRVLGTPSCSPIPVERPSTTRNVREAASQEAASASQKGRKSPLN